MGGKRKMLTMTRRKLLSKEIMDAVMAGQFNMNGRPLEELLDEIDDGIKNDRYPIEVDLQQLIKIWSGAPAPVEQAPATEPQPTNHGTVDQIQQAQAAAQHNGQPSGMQPQGGPPWSESESAQAIMQTGTWPPGHVSQQVQQPVQDPAYLAWLATQPQGGPSPLAAAAGVAPGQMVPTVAGPQPVLPQPGQMTVAQAQQAMSQVETMEIGTPPKDPPVEVDASPVADWLQLWQQANEKVKAAKDIMEHAKANVGAYLDQVGGPDKSKLAMIGGRAVVRRTFVKKKVFKKDEFFATHPEMDEAAFTDETPYYRTELA
jgi:hypothetical protein